MSVEYFSAKARQRRVRGAAYRAGLARRAGGGAGKGGAHGMEGQGVVQGSALGEVGSGAEHVKHGARLGREWGARSRGMAHLDEGHGMPLFREGRKGFNWRLGTPMKHPMVELKGLHIPAAMAL